MEQNNDEVAVKQMDDIPKLSKEIKYYYRNKEVLKEKRLQKLMEDPEYKAKYEERLRRKEEIAEAKRIKEERKILKTLKVAKIMEENEKRTPKND
jgi:hypothetical protein